MTRNEVMDFFRNLIKNHPNNVDELGDRNYIIWDVANETTATFSCKFFRSHIYVGSMKLQIHGPAYNLDVYFGHVDRLEFEMPYLNIIGCEIQVEL